MKFDFKYLNRIAFWISTLGIFAIISDFGFFQVRSTQRFFDGFFFFVLAVGIVSTVSRYLSKNRQIRKKVFVFDLLSIGFTLWIYYMYLFVGVPFETDLLLEWIIRFESCQVKRSYDAGQNGSNDATLVCLDFKDYGSNDATLVCLDCKDYGSNDATLDLFH